MSLQEAAKRYEWARVHFENVGMRNVCGLSYDERIDVAKDYLVAKVQLEKAREEFEHAVAREVSKET